MLGIQIGGTDLLLWTYPAVLSLYWPLVSFMWGLSQKKPYHNQICLRSYCICLNRPRGEDVPNYTTRSGLVGVLILFGSEAKGGTLLRLFGSLNWTKPFLSTLPDKISTADTYRSSVFCFFYIVDLFLIWNNVRYHQCCSTFAVFHICILFYF